MNPSDAIEKAGGWLDYGTLGLLALVLAGLFVLLLVFTPKVLNAIVGFTNAIATFSNSLKGVADATDGLKDELSQTREQMTSTTRVAEERWNFARGRLDDIHDGVRRIVHKTEA